LVARRALVSLVQILGAVRTPQAVPPLGDNDPGMDAAASRRTHTPGALTLDGALALFVCTPSLLAQVLTFALAAPASLSLGLDLLAALLPPPLPLLPPPNHLGGTEEEQFEGDGRRRSSSDGTGWVVADPLPLAVWRAAFARDALAALPSLVALAQVAPLAASTAVSAMAGPDVLAAVVELGEARVARAVVTTVLDCIATAADTAAAAAVAADSPHVRPLLTPWIDAASRVTAADLGLGPGTPHVDAVRAHALRGHVVVLAHLARFPHGQRTLAALGGDVAAAVLERAHAVLVDFLEAYLSTMADADRDFASAAEAWALQCALEPVVRETLPALLALCRGAAAATALPSRVAQMLVGAPAWVGPDVLAHPATGPLEDVGASASAVGHGASLLQDLHMALARAPAVQDAEAMPEDAWVRTASGQPWRGPIPPFIALPASASVNPATASVPARPGPAVPPVTRPRDTAPHGARRTVLSSSRGPSMHVDEFMASARATPLPPSAPRTPSLAPQATTTRTTHTPPLAMEPSHVRAPWDASWPAPPPPPPLPHADLVSARPPWAGAMDAVLARSPPRAKVPTHRAVVAAVDDTTGLVDPRRRLQPPPLAPVSEGARRERSRSPLRRYY
jgi:hypothetical protein